MNLICAFLITLFMATIPSFAQEPQSANDIVSKMQHDLNLSEDQVANITQVIERYVDASNDLQKSIQEGTINPSAIDSQKQQIKAQEDQGISQYLRSDQLNEWNNIQSQMGPLKGKDKGDDNADADEYSNLPNNTPAQ